MNLRKAIAAVGQLSEALAKKPIILVPSIDVEAAMEDDGEALLSCCIDLAGWPSVEGDHEENAVYVYLDSSDYEETSENIFNILFGRTELSVQLTLSELLWSKRDTPRRRILEILAQHLRETDQHFRVELFGDEEVVARSLIDEWKEHIHDPTSMTEVIGLWEPPLAARNKNGVMEIVTVHSHMEALFPSDTIQRVANECY